MSESLTYELRKVENNIQEVKDNMKYLFSFLQGHTKRYEETQKGHTLSDIFDNAKKLKDYQKELEALIEKQKMLKAIEQELK